MKKNGSDRREFLTRSALAIAALPLVPVFGKSAMAAKPAAKAKDVPLPAGEKAVDEAETVAAAIGYKSDVAKIDYKKYPQRKKPETKNDFCDNCALYTKTNEGWGKCQMLPSGLVAAKGWCASYNRKA